MEATERLHSHHTSHDNGIPLLSPISTLIISNNLVGTFPSINSTLESSKSFPAPGELVLSNHLLGWTASNPSFSIPSHVLISAILPWYLSCPSRESWDYSMLIQPQRTPGTPRIKLLIETKLRFGWEIMQRRFVPPITPAAYAG